MPRRGIICDEGKLSSSRHFGSSVIIVDDGIATRSTATAAVRVAREVGARWVIVATLMAAQHTMDFLARIADDVVVLEAPRSFFSVGQAYHDLTQTSDEDVVSVLDRVRPELP